MSSEKIFEILKEDTHSKARTGLLTLRSGQVKTPVFMPIGTLGTVKSLTNNEILTLDYEIILGNTYHLWLRPGMEVIKEAGGLANFNGFKRPMLTDSGGFQAFSLSKIAKFTEEGVTFKSHISGEKMFLSPEISMQIQTTINSDIALVLDECLSAEVDHRKAVSAMKRTQRWAERSKIEFEKLRNENNSKNVLFGIPQGAQFVDLREESAYMTRELDFMGYSIGGVANGGEPEEIMYQQVDVQTSILEKHKPKHLLGVGTPRDIVRMVKAGIDMFDCVYPTRNARHGSLFFWEGQNSYRIEHITNKKYSKNFEPINQNSKYPELREYSLAYLSHLFKAKELLGLRLATLHNLEFYYDLMILIRQKINNGSFSYFADNFDQIK
jgi:queuine tRNA-ribosyltransferase